MLVLRKCRLPLNLRVVVGVVAGQTLTELIQTLSAVVATSEPNNDADADGKDDSVFGIHFLMIAMVG